MFDSTTHPASHPHHEQSLLERVLQEVQVGITPYLELVDLRNAFVRVRSIDHPEEYIDVYKSTLTGLANALLKSERELSKRR